MKRKRIMVVSDNHGDERDSRACKHAIEFAKSYKPDIRLHLGDCFDFRWLRKSASKDEQEGRITDDLNAGIEFIHAYKPTHFLWGNHDERVRDKSETSVGFMQHLCLHVIEKIDTALGKCSTKHYDKSNVLEFGGWKFAHGFGGGVHAVRDHAKIYGSIAIGHFHRVERVPAPKHGGRAVGVCVGCLCKLSLPYNRAQLNTFAQGHGFAFGEFNASGRLILQQEAIT